MYIQGESKKTDTFDIQMNNKGVSFFWLTLYIQLIQLIKVVLSNSKPSTSKREKHKEFEYNM
jgi:hypothetical protein